MQERGARRGTESAETFPDLVGETFRVDRTGSLCRRSPRAVFDFVASLTDKQAVSLLDALSGRAEQPWSDSFVL